MSQPEESQPKTDKTDDVLLRPGGDPQRRIEEVPARNKDDQGQVRVERDGELREVDEQSG